MMNRSELIEVMSDLGEVVRASLRLGISPAEAAERIVDSIVLDTDDPVTIVKRVKTAAADLG